MIRIFTIITHVFALYDIFLTYDTSIQDDKHVKTKANTIFRRAGVVDKMYLL